MQQANKYAIALDLPFAYSTNGHGIVEHDLLTGQERDLAEFPTLAELVTRYLAYRGLPPEVEDKLLIPYHLGDRVPRYYQSIAIQRASAAILTRQKRVLLTLAMGTGKTEIAFQIAWKLLQAHWNQKSDNRPCYLQATCRISTGIDELGSDADVFKVLPATRHINMDEIGQAFGGVQKLRQVLDVHTLSYPAPAGLVQRTHSSNW